MANNDFSLSNLSRRDFIKGASIVGVGGLLLAQPVSSFLSREKPRERPVIAGEVRDLYMYNVNTHELIHTIFFANGAYIKENYRQLCYFLRDSHQNAVHWIDPRLLTMLYDMQSIFGKRLIHVLSGYRTPRTNAQLARTTRGVGKDSFHMKGRAIDIRIPGIDTYSIREVARTLRVGGVGYYPGQRFVHVDTGPIRTW